MTSATTRRRRRLALMAATTAAAMVLLPGTAMANPLDDVINNVNEVTRSVTGGGHQAPGTGAPSGALPKVGSPALVPTDDPTTKAHLGGEPTEDDDSEGHETDDPAFPDHGSGEVANVEFGDDSEEPQDVADVTKSDATVEDDDSTHSDVTVLGLFGEEIAGSHADSEEGPGEESENPTEGLCEGSGGGLCLSLLYSDAFAAQTDEGSFSAARGGIAALCVGGEDEDTTSSADCEGPITAGVAEGISGAERNSDGNTATGSENDAATFCLGNTEGDEDDICDGLGAQVLHSESTSSADDEGAETERNSYLLGFDANGERMGAEETSEPNDLSVPPGCGGEDDEDPALLCLFVNQGESFVFPGGAASAQEALHLDLFRNTPIAILTELGKAESVARDFDGDGEDPTDPEDPKDPKDPECDDAVDNDGDGDIDFPADSDCESPEDDNEGPDDGDDNGKPECSDGVDNDDDGHTDFGDDPDCDSDEDDSEAGDDGNGAGDGDDDGDGLAFTGADISPLLAGAFLLIGLGALTVAATRRRTGNQSS